MMTEDPVTVLMLWEQVKTVTPSQTLCLPFEIPSGKLYILELFLQRGRTDFSQEALKPDAVSSHLVVDAVTPLGRGC